jgi:hypothetical protein
MELLPSKKLLRLNIFSLFVEQAYLALLAELLQSV